MTRDKKEGVEIACVADAVQSGQGLRRACEGVVSMGRQTTISVRPTSKPLCIMRCNKLKQLPVGYSMLWIYFRVV